MSVTPHKYWTIVVDGMKVPAVVTNIAYQGIIVTPGKHHIEMEYRNELVRVGMLITLITGAVLLGILLLYRPKLSLAAVPAYEEPVHVVADASGTHLEDAAPATSGENQPPGEEVPST